MVVIVVERRGESVDSREDVGTDDDLSFRESREVVRRVIPMSV
jgi:hypothetical protein